MPSPQDSASVTRRLKTVNETLGKATTPGAKDSAFANLVDQYGAGKYNGKSYTPLQEIDPEIQSSVAAAAPGTIIGPVRTPSGTRLVELVDVKDSGEVYVKAQHILIKLQDKSKEDSVKAFADKIAQQARSGGNFATLASQYSGDPGSAQRGGDLGYFKKGMMVKPFEEACFDNPVGSIVGPIKTDFGYHIIKINDRTSKSFKLRDLKFDVRVGNTTKNQLRFRAKQFHDRVAGGESLDSAAAKEKLQVLESGQLSRTDPAAGSMRLTYFAYAGKVGDVSDVIELRDGSFVVAQISKVSTAGPMEFADAKAAIMERLMRNKKLDLLKARAEKVAASLAPGDSLGKLAMIDPGVQVRNFSDVTAASPFPGVGYDFMLTSTAFGLQPAQTSKLVRGDRGYYIVRISSKEEPTDKQFAAEQMQFTQQYLGQKRSSLFQKWLQKEREHAEIADLRTGKF
jgi:parvulin-like peptidyl-prolyl isomerase